MIGLDTNAIIDLFKGDEHLKKILIKYPHVATTDMNYLEIFSGMNPADKRTERESEYYNQFFDNTSFLTLTRRGARKV